MSTTLEEFEQHVLEQQELGKKILQLLTNSKKDGVTRKTKEYVSKRLTTLEDLWNKVTIINNKLVESNYPTHSYFTTGYLKQILEAYNDAKNYLATCQTAEQTPIAIQPKPNTETQHYFPKSNEGGEAILTRTSVEENQEVRLKKQKIRLNQLDQMILLINQELNENKSKSRYEILTKKIVKSWDGIQDLNEEILVHAQTFDHSYFVDNHYEVMEEKVDNALENLEKKTSNNQVASNVSHPNLALPKIQIPIFDGGYESWSNFYDIFLKVIHENIFLTNTEKLQYLKTHLKGEGSKLIQHLHLMEQNYETAWDILKNRYQNKRLLVSKLIDRILDFPNIKEESANKIRELHDISTECVKAINNLDISTSSWGPILGRIIVRKWDSDTNRLYEQHIEKPHDVQDYDVIMKFLERRFQSLEAIVVEPKKQVYDNATKFKQHSSGSPCICCNQQHLIYQCQKFKSLSTDEKFQLIRKNRLCYNCMTHDFKEKCHSQIGCRTCGQQHHTLLHKDKTIQPNIKSNQPNKGKITSYASTAAEQPVEDKATTTINHVGSEQKTVLLATALVEAAAATNISQMLRVLIDQGSQSSFITEAAAQRLGLPRQKCKASITGLGDDQPIISNWKMETQLKPRFPSSFILTTGMIILPKLTKSLPDESLVSTTAQSWQNQLLADPSFNKSGPIDVILGAEEYSKIILDGLLKTDEGLIGQNTEFGWMLSGLISNNNFSKAKITSVVACTEDEQLTKFWEIEEIDSPKHCLSEDEKLCEEIYKHTTQRNENGSYTVRIPFRNELNNLGNSRPRAAARLIQLENRFLRHPNLKQQYMEFVQEYIDLGHMRKVSVTEIPSGKYYIPHQPVIRETSTTTKLRVVFDASSKTSTNVSLNDAMYVGPRLQQDLSEIILRWRKHRIVFTADIEKMYRQIQIHPDDQPYQRILWRFNQNQMFDEYELTTVTYGTASAPYLAIRTLQQLAHDEQTKFPEASQVILEDFYVDDVLSGSTSIEKATKLQHELIDLLHSGGFFLRKWASNHPELLQALPDNFKDETTLQTVSNEPKKSLGILWAPKEDAFRFKVCTYETTKLTKRHILSEIAKLFDPLGWIAPVIIKAKLLIQELWLQNLEWDDQVNSKIAIQWKSFQNQINKIEELQIPRWIHYDDTTEVELHGFCDASEKAYGAVVYSRVVINGRPYITLLHAKSKVAPARSRSTLPRLELCSAALLAKLIEKTIKALNIPTITRYAWTDSMIALGWIKGDPSRWKTFVANRVAQIQTTLPSEHWRHVKTDDNPADAISRGMDPNTLKDHELWWKGPTWLQYDDKWPNTKEIPTVTQEIKLCCHAKVQNFDVELVNRFSNYTRMIRVLSYCRRIATKPIPKGNLSFSEQNETMLLLIKQVQKVEFNEEYKALYNKEYIQKGSRLITLAPFMDDKEIIRVGGRLKHSMLSFNQKHQMILPHNCHFTKLVIRDAHQKTLHGGNQATLAYTRNMFWIIKGKQAIRSIINECTKCIRYKGQVAQQEMGQLPQPRVTPSPPFSHTGVDYAGPLQIRVSKGRGNKSYKGYISIFVCLATKAIHLEVVSDMSTDAFLAAYRRFTARRGHCSHMFSDNGTNFVGACNHLEKEIRKITKEPGIQDSLATAGTRWHFIPPSAPHFGGLWEAGVKSMKHHLRRIIGTATLTFEELTTLTHQIEACLNSRPLCPISNDPDDIFALTPGHFLIGRELISLPDPVTTNINSNISLRWRLVQKQKNDIWKAWSMEYLNRLQQRYKWNIPQENLSIGTMVLIKEDTINPSQWPLARIIECHPGEDGKLRVVTLKKAGGTTLKRAIHRLIPLPTQIENTPNIDPLSCQTQSHSARLEKTKLPPKTKPESKIPTKVFILLFLTFLLSNFPKTVANFTVTNAKPGLYVEHLGYAKIHRGMYRIQINYSKSKIKQDAAEVSNVIEQFKNLCEKTKMLSEETHCTSLIHHLVEQENYITLVKNSIDGIQPIRKTRGIFGQLLTSVFGVNDEVYKDIEDLNRNQQNLIKASNHQTKFMISALSTFNDSETRIFNQLDRFRTKMNQGLESINQMQHWFSTVDINKLNIHLLSSYQVAVNYISEINNYYSKLLEVQFNEKTLFDIITPAHINKLISSANEKLPSNLQILTSKTLKVTTEEDEANIIIFGFFLIVDTSEFLLIRGTPTPLRIENGSYWEMEIPYAIIAVDYNSQLYFEVTQMEFTTSITISPNNFVCSPTVVKNIENNPTCAIDLIYHRSDSTTCISRKHRLTNMIWKQLYMPNTWLFINNNRSQVAITCSGVREDVSLNQTGIIRISHDCIINTKQNILTPTRLDTSPIISSYFKAMDKSFNVSVDYQTHDDIPSESILRLDNNLIKLKNNQEQLHEELQETIWATVKHHSILISTSTTIIMTALVLTIWGVHLLVIHLCKRRRVKQTQNVPSNDIELQTLEPLQIQGQPRNTREGFVELEPLR